MGLQDDYSELQRKTRRMERRIAELEASEGSSDMQQALEEAEAKARSVGGLKAQVTRLKREKAELQAELDSLREAMKAVNAAADEALDD